MTKRPQLNFCFAFCFILVWGTFNYFTNNGYSALAWIAVFAEEIILLTIASQLREAQPVKYIPWTFDRIRKYVQPAVYAGIVLWVFSFEPFFVKLAPWQVLLMTGSAAVLGYGYYLVWRITRPFLNLVYHDLVDNFEALSKFDPTDITQTKSVCNRLFIVRDTMAFYIVRPVVWKTDTYTLRVLRVFGTGNYSTGELFDWGFDLRGLKRIEPGNFFAIYVDSCLSNS